VLVHRRADEGRRALADAERTHVTWLEGQVREVAAEARLRDLQARYATLRRETAASEQRLRHALVVARHARRRVVHGHPRVVYRVRTVLVSGGGG
jgi:hypothetical protein